MALTVGSLFSGIGGMDLGLERAGFVTRWLVEIERFARLVLAKNFPGRPIYGDIRGIDWTTVEPVDLIAGGFPCQPVSEAGRRRGQADDRWLWPEFARAIRALRPRYVLVENVPGLLRPWRDKDGCGLWHEAPVEEVLADLATLGYVGWADSIPAEAVGAPHERDRVWILAFTEGERPSSWPREPRRALSSLEPQRPGAVADAARLPGRGRSGAMGQRADAGRHGARLADATGEGRRRSGRDRRGHAADAESLADERHPLADATGSRSSWSITRQGRSGLAAAGSGRVRPAEPGVVRAADGLPAGLDGHRWPAPPGPQHEWEPPRTVERGAVPNRTRRVGALGNAVVPQIPELIGRWIVEFDEGRLT